MIESTEHILDQIAIRVSRRGFELPVIMALETVRPLAGSISILGEALVPILTPLLGISFKQLQDLIQDRDIISRLIDKLEFIQSRGEQRDC